MVRFGPSRSPRAFDIVRWSMVLLGVFPFVVAWLDATHATHRVGVMLRWLYGLQCHQRAVRSFSLWHASLPVCARCLGIYTGLGLAGIVVRPRLRHELYKAWILVGVVCVGLDVATEWVGLREESGTFRFLTGAFLSYGIAVSILAAL